MSPPLSGDLNAEVERIIALRAITPHFQPIVDLHAGDIVGYEGLIRGPSDSFLHSPVALIEAASALDRLSALEMQTVPTLLQAFARLHLPGSIFINVTPSTIANGERFHEHMLGFIHEAGLAPSRVIIELTETHAITEEHQLLCAIHALRDAGFVVAIDDLGEGFSGLRRWSELRPHYVKIDRHFVDGLSQDPLRQQFIRSIMDMARTANTRVVAEGVETESDLLLLRQLGVHCAQGYVIARPVAAPRASLRPDIVRLLRHTDRAHGSGRPGGRSTLAAHLARSSRTLTLAATCSDVIDAFRSDPHLYAIPVLDGTGHPLGLLRSHDALLTASQLYFMDVFGKQSCEVLMDRRPLIFDANSTLQSMAAAVANIDERHLTDGFLVTHGGRYVGTGRISDLLRAVSDSQLSAARYANPLTQLPGNVPLDEHIDLLLHQQQAFVVVHWDIGSFKAFNDAYGYRLGDDVILFTADLLRGVHDAERDLLGHVGGDDFVSVYTSADWLERIHGALAAFDSGVRKFFSGEHLRDGGYISLNRQGLPVFHELPTLAAGVVPVQPNSYDSHRHIARAAAETKRLAKQGSGSRCFVDRRTPSASDSPTELPEPVLDRRHRLVA